MSLDYDYLLKITIVGDSNVGKSCLLLQFVHHCFQNFHDPTIGVAFGEKTVTVEGKSLKLQIWDTVYNMQVGQESYASIARSYYHGSTGVLVTFDITSRESFEHVKRWVNEVTEYGSKEAVMVLVGTKSDLDHKREVGPTEGEALAASFSMTYVEVSAKEAQNVTAPFILVCQGVLNNLENGRYNLEDENCLVKSGRKEFAEVSKRLKVTTGKKAKKCAC